MKRAVQNWMLKLGIILLWMSQTAVAQLVSPPEADQKPTEISPESFASDKAEEDGDDREAIILKPAKTIKEALAKIPLGGVNQAVKDLQRFGNEGDAAAFFHLGEIYRLGIGRAANVEVAVMYYRLAATGGHDRSALSLANLLYFDVGQEQARNEALSIWRDYAVKGHVEALYVLGLLHWNGAALGLSDPVRGYGLIWRAADAGYKPAIDAELEMRQQIAFEPRQAGIAFAEALTIESFGDSPLSLDLVLAGIAPAVSERDAPESWPSVWRVEVGFALKEKDLALVAGRIAEAYPDKTAIFARTQIASASAPGTYRLLYGPMNDAEEAVAFCVSLKRIGQDCFARAPE